MMAKTPSFESLIGQLLEVLDHEIALLALRYGQLQALEACLSSRDEARTETLLGEIEDAQAEQDRADERLAWVRSRLSPLMGRPDGKLRLGELAAQLPQTIGLAIEQRRGRIIELAGAVRSQNLRTAVVLSECAHLNHLLLQGLMPASSSVDTYASGGRSVWRSASGLIDARG